MKIEDYLKKSNKGKWKNKGLNEKQRKLIYSKLRIKANTILKNRYKKEYSIILKELLNIELKGGLK